MQPNAVAVVIYCNQGWARLRVRGLLRNLPLARRLEAQSQGRLVAAVETGSVKVLLNPSRDVEAWVRWIAARVRAQSQPQDPQEERGKDSGARDARPPTALARATAAGRPSSLASHSPPHAFHTLAPVQLTSALGLAADHCRTGLDARASRERLRRYGANEIEDVQARSAAQILLGQFSSVPVALLAVSAAVSLASGAWAEAVVICAVLAANATIGYLTERRAEETVSSLRKLGPPQCTVLREGSPVTVDAKQVVVGDILVLKPGQPIAADARLMDAHRLAVNEAALTGESLPVRKQPELALPMQTPLGEQRNMVFMGTVVSGGAGLALVVATGERTVLGRIRQLAQLAESPRTQLQVELDRLGRRLAVGAGGVCIGLLALGWLRRRPFLPLLRTAVSLGVAAIPEGLPTVATSLLASSVRALRDEGVYPRSLAAVENLGAVDTVCFDKTGTLTQNRMCLESLAIGMQVVQTATADPLPPLPEGWAHVVALCNTLEPDPQGKAWQGSATELALLQFTMDRGIDAEGVRRAFPVHEVRHRSEHHPYMVTIHRAPEGLLIAAKGRPDEVLARCDTWFDGKRVVRLTPTARRQLLALNQQMAGSGHRVLALAWRRQPAGDFGQTAGLSWLGMAGLADALRPGLARMMQLFRSAGVRPMMVTGDQVPTAQAVAWAIGLDHDRRMLDAGLLPEDTARLRALLEDASGFARTSPAMKLHIVRALQAGGHVVAMTGDGINDGPALKCADVGVAMGVAGTDFAQAMSDLVLRDDDPAALLHAIARGRTAFLNIRKSLRYLLATNISELLTTTLAVAAGLEAPLDPMALLWVNIVTDTWPAIALGLEPEEPDVLERPPVSLKAGILDRREWIPLGTDAAVMALSTLASYGFGLARHGPGPRARTNAFMTLTTSQLLYALAMRSATPLRSGGLQPNPQLRRALAVSLAAQAGAVLLPGARRLLGTTPLGPLDAAAVLITSAVPLLARELLKERAPS